MVKFDPWYFFIAIVLFVVEIIIAVFINDSFVRPYFGDFLVVIFIYCFIRSFWNGAVNKTALWVLLFSYSIEVSQHFKFIKFIGLEKSKAAKLILGSSFAWCDIIAYTLGILFVLIVEKLRVTGIRKPELSSQRQG